MIVIRRFIVALAVLLASPIAAQVPKATLNSNTSTSFPDNATGAITPATTRSYFTGLINSFQQFAGVRSVVVTTDAISVNDYGQLLVYNNAGAIAVSLPQGVSSFQTFNVYVSNSGVGAVTITPLVSTINGAATLVLQTGQSAWIVSDGTNYQVQKSGLNAVQLTAGANISISGGSSPTIATIAPIGATTYTAHGILLGEGTSNITPTAVMTNGQLLVGQTGADPLPKTISQDCAFAASGAATCLKTNNVSFTAYATAAIGQLPGETSTGSATAGNIGEYIEGIRAVASGLGVSSATPTTITSITLSAGDWDVDAVLIQNPSGASITSVGAALVLTTNTNDVTNPGRQSVYSTAAQSPGNVNITSTIPPYRFSLSGSTTIFVTAIDVFTGGTMTVSGIVRARRMR